MCLRDYAWESGVEVGRVSWTLWIGRIGTVVSLTVFMADVSLVEVDLHIVTALVVDWDVCCELNGD